MLCIMSLCFILVCIACVSASAGMLIVGSDDGCGASVGGASDGLLMVTGDDG